MRRVVARRQILEVAVPPPSSHPPALVIRCGAGVLLVAAALAFASHLATAQPLFGPRADYPADDEPRAIAIADFNEDGWPDIVTTSLTAPTVAILLNHRDGTFAAPVFWAVGSPAGDVAVGDMNTDDHLDLVVTQASTSTVSVRTGNGDGTFHSLLHYGVGLEPVGVGIADFNHDGHPDLAVVNAGTRTCCASASVLLADSGGFTSEPLLHLTRSPIAIGVRDFSGDGILDLVVTDNESGSVTVMLGTEGGAFGAGTDFYAGLYPHHLAIGDLDGDGRPDLVVGADTGFNTLLGSGGGTFGTPTHFDGGTTPAVTLGDLDGDGRLDVATADWDSDSASVHLGRGDGTFGTRIGFPAGHRCASVVIADLDRDGHPDMAVTNALSNSVSVFLAAPNAAAVEPGTSGSRLERARPDPFVTSTQVAYELARAGRVRLSVFDLHGREVSVLEDGPLAAGPHTVTWRAQDHGGVSIPAGAYFIRLQLPEGGERVERVVRLR